MVTIRPTNTASFKYFYQEGWVFCRYDVTLSTARFLAYWLTNSTVSLLPGAVLTFVANRDFGWNFSTAFSEGRQLDMQQGCAQTSFLMMPYFIHKLISISIHLAEIGCFYFFHYSVPIENWISSKMCHTTVLKSHYVLSL